MNQISPNLEKWYKEKLSLVFTVLARALEDLATTTANITYTESQLIAQRKRRDELLTLIEELKEVVKNRQQELDFIDSNPSGR